MTVLPEPPTTTGQATNPLADAVIRAAVDNAIHEARRSGTSPQAVIGNAEPVAQTDGGRPPMSQKATDASVLMLSGGVASVLVGGGISLVLWSSGHADPTVIGWMTIGPPAALLSLKGLVKAFKTTVRPEIHNHNGTEYHEHHTDQRKSIWQKNVTKH